MLKCNLTCVRTDNSFLCEDVIDTICNIHRNLLLLCLKSPNTFKMKWREITVIIRSTWSVHSPFISFSLVLHMLFLCANEGHRLRTSLVMMSFSLDYNCWTSQETIVMKKLLESGWISVLRVLGCLCQREEVLHFLQAKMPYAIHVWWWWVHRDNGNILVTQCCWGCGVVYLYCPVPPDKAQVPLCHWISWQMPLLPLAIRWRPLWCGLKTVMLRCFLVKW